MAQNEQDYPVMAKLAILIVLKDLNYSFKT